MSMIEFMKAAVLYGAKDLRLEDVRTPVPSRGEALIRVEAAGICGSDLHYYSKGRTATFKPVRPFILGHEFSGIVELVCGDGFDKGDRVVIEPGIPCSECYYCRRGRYNLCTHLRFIGTAATIPHIDGGFAEYCKVPVESLHRIPDELSFEEASLAEPLSVAIHACRRGNIDAGERALILGAGPIGLLTTSVVMLKGGIEPIVVDRIESRLQAASDIGARIIDFEGKSVVEEVEKLTGGEGVDIVFEASGSPSAASLAFKVVRRGGKIVFIGNLPDEDIPVRLLDVVVMELDVKGTFRYANTFEMAISILSKKFIPINRIITHRFGLENILEAVDRALSGEAIKAIVTP